MVSASDWRVVQYCQKTPLDTVRFPLVKSTPRVGVPFDTNRFHRRCGVSVRKRLSGAWGLKVVPMESIGSVGHE